PGPRRRPPTHSARSPPPYCLPLEQPALLRPPLGHAEPPTVADARQRTLGVQGRHRQRVHAAPHHAHEPHIHQLHAHVVEPTPCPIWCHGRPPIFQESAPGTYGERLLPPPPPLPRHAGRLKRASPEVIYTRREGSANGTGADSAGIGASGRRGVSRLCPAVASQDNASVPHDSLYPATL